MTTLSDVRKHHVEDIMTKDPVVVLRSDSLQELARILDANEFSGVPVVDEMDRLVGVVSKTDIIRRCLAGPEGSPLDTSLEILAEGLGNMSMFEPEQLGVVEDFMSPDLLTASLKDSIAVIARRMSNENVHRIIVVDDESVVLGIVTALDILRYFPD